MIVIVNSDILYGDYLKGRLPRALEGLCNACVGYGASIVIPGTSLLEFRRDQAKRVRDARGRIESAYRILDEFGIRHDWADAQELVGDPDLVTMLRGTGVGVRVVDPEFTDLWEAHRRACLHEAPQPPETQHDEMRDLVIWMIAIRIARQEGGAVLLSRDKVHLHEGGNNEAAGVGLRRVATIEAALELLNVESPVALLVRQLLEPAWQDLIEAGVPLTTPMHLLSVSEPSFTQGVKGLSSGRFRITAEAPAGQSLRSAVEVSVIDDIVTSLSMTSVVVGDRQWREGSITVTPNRAIATPITPYDERLKALKEVLGE